MSEASRHVLIVDDEKDMCSNLATLLGREGISSLMTHDGETALKMLRLNQPDMAIVDVCMPDMDGMELLERIKELAPDLPVVLITGHAKVRGAIDAMKSHPLSG